jgi:hypothetical protein
MAVVIGVGLTMIGPLPLLGALLMVVAAVSWAIRWEAAGGLNTPMLVPLPLDTEPPGSASG